MNCTSLLKAIIAMPAVATDPAVTMKAGAETETSRGFSLIELMVVLAISAIVLSIAVPSYQNFTMNNRLSAQTNLFNSILQFSRSLAIRNKSNVLICSSSNNTSCNNQAAWEQGWIVCQTNDNSTCLADSIVKVGEDVSSSLSLRSVGFSGNTTKIVFSEDGTLERGYNRGSYVLCDRRGAEKAKGLIVSVTGKIQTAYDGNKDGYLDIHDGGRIACPAA